MFNGDLSHFLRKSVAKTDRRTGTRTSNAIFIVIKVYINIV